MSIAFDFSYERAISKAKSKPISPEFWIILGQFVAVAVTIPAAILCGVWLQ